ncbi:hypothetical protein [Granulicella tundricola]|uniref:Uncharacterized protein n=1 Tax=Granulicella tundricola (strain ATCC BAA-1859 / DSM 23138 / MP5ACTX9) TaxID=1198114 RepID=E8WZW1_GRATM|nr:hypothetical protein [Granulicella tundricola]ADW67772.1 hypothetical protein AciX9_0702 [Granulicella tundricola MP5ACTX9]
MKLDNEFLFLTAFAFVIFSAIAFFFGRFTDHLRRHSRRPLPPRAFLLAFRLWFSALALGALALLLFSRHGLFAPVK